MTHPDLNVLFLCTGNSARSILAEALLNHLAGGRFRAWSAGSHPKGQVHPMALETLRRAGLPVDGLRSKSWDEFERPGAPAMDLIITVCDNAAGEACPAWLGHPVSAHWGIADPAAMSAGEQPAAFDAAYRFLEQRIQRLLALPLQQLDTAALRQQLAHIGHAEGASAGAVAKQEHAGG